MHVMYMYMVLTAVVDLVRYIFITASLVLGTCKSNQLAPHNLLKAIPKCAEYGYTCGTYCHACPHVAACHAQSAGDTNLSFVPCVHKGCNSLLKDRLLLLQAKVCLVVT